MTKPKCFVIQKFGIPFFDELYDDIEISVNNANAICERADQMLGATPLLTKIKQRIEEAVICIAEVSLDDCRGTGKRLSAHHHPGLARIRHS